MENLPQSLRKIADDNLLNFRELLDANKWAPFATPLLPEIDIVPTVLDKVEFPVLDKPTTATSQLADVVKEISWLF